MTKARDTYLRGVESAALGVHLDGGADRSGSVREADANPVGIADAGNGRAGRLTGTAATTPRAALGLRAERVTPVPRAAATTGTTPTPATAAWEAISRVRSREPQPVPKITESRKVRGACEATATSSVRFDSAREYATFAERPTCKRERA